MTTPLLWSLEQAGQALGGISARTVRRLIQSGELPAIRINPSTRKDGKPCRPLLRVRPEDARAYIDSLAAGGDNPVARGSVPTEEAAQCQQQKASTKRPTRPTGGRATPTPTVSEFGVLLGFPSR